VLAASAYLLLARGPRDDDQLQYEGADGEQEAGDRPEVEHGDVRRASELRGEGAATQHGHGEAGESQEEDRRQPGGRQVDGHEERGPGQSHDDDGRHDHSQHVVTGVALQHQAYGQARIGT